jgi:hypothetical protein
MKEALSSAETSVLTRTTRRNIREDTIIHSHRRENLKSYTEKIYLLNLFVYSGKNMGPHVNITFLYLKCSVNVAASINISAR